MTLAAELRWAMVPPLSFVNDVVEVCAVLEPAYEIAGDTFDYAHNGDVTHVAVFDAVGHGLEASRLANLAVVAYRHSRRRDVDLAHTVAAIDRVVREQVDPERFLTSLLVELDTTTGRLRIANAGHPPPLLVRRERVIGEVRCERRPPIGFGAVDTPITEVALEPGDRLLLYTDGVVEARSASGEQFGVERLADFMARAAFSEEPPAETMRRLIHSVLDHEAGQLRDDATVVLLGWKRRAGDSAESLPARSPS